MKERRKHLITIFKYIKFEKDKENSMPRSTVNEINCSRANQFKYQDNF